MTPNRMTKLRSEMQESLDAYQHASAKVRPAEIIWLIDRLWQVEKNREELPAFLWWCFYRDEAIPFRDTADRIIQYIEDNYPRLLEEWEKERD